ncbi:putative mfs multidrug protein [Botrytis fragariae]|uniref:Putative mfs multidrug protein n=1 Tax=Botrytis fragariae TaxID=1964551 RepID=A0A8H6ASI4_9HELO|nr:putative mfs multidrug protein [Botrytis fragariae]KAF5872773.1 putative mfs multidrug protein [Botrytis fragariae]
MAPTTTITAGNIPVAVFTPGKRYIAACTSILIVNLACALDATTIAVALPTISEALNGNAIEAFWAGTSFLLTSTIWQPVFIALSHVFGRRPLLLFSLILFTIGSSLGGAAQSMPSLLVGRCLQGSGVGGILALTEALITDMVPLRQRGNAMALLGVVWALGSVTGPLIGGTLADKNAWRWIFYLNLPIIAIGFVGCVWFLKLERKERTIEEKLSEIDYIGSIIFVGSLTSFLIPLTWGGVSYSWKSWHTLIPLLIGATGLVIFCIYEAMLAKKPIIPTRLFRNPSTTIAYFCTFLHGMILWSIVYYAPFYFMSVQGYTSMMAGVAALPETLTIVPMAIIVGIFAAKTGKYRWSLWLGWALTAFGCGMLYLLDVGTPVVAWVFLMLGSGIGMGLLYPAMSLAIQASAPQEDAATAAGLFTFFRALGQTVGVAITAFGVYLGEPAHISIQTGVTSPPYATPAAVKGRVLAFIELRATQDFTIIVAQFGYTIEEVTANVVALIPLINALPPESPEVVDFRLVSATSIKTIWLAMCAFAVTGLISSCFVKSYGLDQALVTDQGFAIGVKKVDLEKTEVTKKGGQFETSKTSVNEEVKELVDSPHLSVNRSIDKVSEWEKLDIFGNRKSVKSNDVEKLKLSAGERREYLKMPEEDACPMFGKDY